MSETLSQKQRRFAKLLPVLFQKLHELGYEATLGDAYRDPRLHGAVGVKLGYGHRNSCHKLRLAIDINLWKDNVYLTKSEDYEPIGVIWESLGGTWGGRFEDGNHFSLEHEGMK